MAKKCLKWTGICIGVVLLCAIALLLWLTIAEYKPAAVEEVEVGDVCPGVNEIYAEGTPLSVGDSLTVLSLNTGYGGLGKEADFFMDGGTGVAPSTSDLEKNTHGIAARLRAEAADVYFLQEVDTNSSRSGSKDFTRLYWQYINAGNREGYFSAHALNYSCPFVPYPWPPIRKVHSGVQTLSSFFMEKAERIALPCPFSWPVSTANLKRCLLVGYVPLEDSDRQLVLVNLHLEAYDDGDGKTAQTKMLMKFLTSEYEKGNYAIAGGDFNQTFPGALEAFPVKSPELWTPGVLEEDILPEGWQFAYDLSTPSCRLLNEPYDAASQNTQFYVIDGFILSPNVQLNSVETKDAAFGYTDHNPVLLDVTLSE